MANIWTGLPVGSVVLNMDTDGLTKDAMGGNNWTDNNTVGQTADAKQGDRAGDFEQADDESLSITDGNYTSGAALRSDDAVKDITICLWAKFEDFVEVFDILFSKWVNPQRSILLYSADDAGSDYLTVFIGDGGTGQEEVTVFSTAFATSIYYHIEFAFRNSDKAWRLRIWDDNASNILGANESGNTTNNIGVGNQIVYVGAYEVAPEQGTHDGPIDEVVIIPAFLSFADMDLIRQGIYGAAVGGETVVIGKASLTSSGKAVNPNAETVLAIAQGALTSTGKAFNVNQATVIALARATMFHLGKAISVNDNVVIAKGALTATGRTVQSNMETYIQIAKAGFVATGKALKVNVTIHIAKAAMGMVGRAVKIAGEVVRRRTTWLLYEALRKKE